MLDVLQVMLDNVSMNSIQKAIEILGGTNATARAIGVSAQAVSQWADGGRPVPIERCVEIERLTSGAVTRKDLRPDDWHRIWPELAAA